MGDPGCFGERSFQQRPESETTTQKPRHFLLSGGATKLRFYSVLCLVIEKTSFGNLDNSPGYEEPILVYCGNGHQAYQAEIKSLYPDVALAQEAGIRVKILKTGRDSYG